MPSLDTRAAIAAVRSYTGIVPEVGIILGSGLGALAREITGATRIPYAEIPGLRRPTVESHAGELIVGQCEGRSVAVCSGRFHLYEGYSPAEVVFPVRLLGGLGIHTLIVSNISGGMHPLWTPGDLVLLADHINLLGTNPLIGPNDDRLGRRFPDMSEAYDRGLRALARAVALEQQCTLREGVYVAVPGPSLETAAEYRMLRMLGADIVGMSTVPEVIAAVHQGIRVLGLSIITDQCLPDSLEAASVERILAIAGEAEPRLAALMRGVLARIDDNRRTT
jgi:purine-nucleoside phosphorylase